MMPRGTQIIYVPLHAMCNPDHPDCQQGFVTSQREDVTYCRYFFKNGDLRTKSVSEQTPTDMIVVKDTREQSIVEYWLKWIEEHS